MIPAPHKFYIGFKKKNYMITAPHKFYVGFYFLFHMITAPHKFYVGFRYVHPLTEEAIDSMEWYSFIHLLSLYCRLTFPSELVSD